MLDIPVPEALDNLEDQLALREIGYTYFLMRVRGDELIASA